MKKIERNGVDAILIHVIKHTKGVPVTEAAGLDDLPRNTFTVWRRGRVPFALRTELATAQIDHQRLRRPM